MKHQKPGIYGAKVQSWDYGPRLLFRTLRDKNPDVTADDFVPIFRRALEKHPDCEEFTASIFHNWCSNTAAAFRTMTEAERQENADARAAARVATKLKNQQIADTAVAVAEALVTRKAKALIMGSIQNNGKLGDDCTAADWRKVIAVDAKASPLKQHLADTLKRGETTKDRYKSDAAIIKAARIVA